MIYFRVRFYIIDSWQSPDTVILQFDGRNFSIGDMSQNKLMFTNNHCGSSGDDAADIFYAGKSNHNGSNVTVRVISNINRRPSVASFGFRKLSLLFVNRSSSDFEMSCVFSTYSLTNNYCGCEYGYYKDTITNKCKPCHQYCLHCFGPLSNQCYACSMNPAASFNGTHCFPCADGCINCFGPASNQCTACDDRHWHKWDYTCQSSCSSPSYAQQTVGDVLLCKVPCYSGQYYLWNGTCSSTCNIPFIQRTSNFGQFCDWPCGSSEYLYWNNTCMMTCPWPFVSSANSGYYRCSLPCGLNKYLYSNGSCLLNCSLPFTQQVQQEVLFCNWPCSSTEALYWNSTCLPTCVAPRVSVVESIYRKCTPPCGLNKYLYPNGTCLQNCSSLFIEKTQDEIKYCDWPCSSSEFLYWNSSCTSSCPSPLVQSLSHGYKICQKPCEDLQYLYPNGSCLFNCSPPFNQSLYNQVPTCDYPCNFTAGEYYDVANNLCVTTCEYRQINDTHSGLHLCLPPCVNPLDYYYESSETCSSFVCNSSYKYVESPFRKCVLSIPSTSALTSAPAVTPAAEASPLSDLTSSTEQARTIMTNIGIAMAAIYTGVNPVLFNLKGFVKMLPYIRYMNISYPARLEYILDTMNSTLVSFSFGFSMPQAFKAHFPKHDLPCKFDRYQFHSSFIVNYWQCMTSLALILAVIGLMDALCILTKKRPRVNHLLQRIKIIAKWNFFLIIFCTNLDGVVLPTSLELRTLNTNSFMTALSFLFCVLLNFAVIYVFYLIIRIIIDLRKNKSQVHTGHFQATSRNSWKQYQVLFKGSKDDSFATHFFMFPYLARTYIFHIIIGHLFNYPLAQTLLILALSCLMLSYMIFKAPFVSRIAFYQSIFDESLLLAVNGCILGLAILDSCGVHDMNHRTKLGDVIILINIILSFVDVGFMALYVIDGIRTAIKSMKDHKSKGLTSWLLIFLSPFEVGGMDLEVLPDSNPAPVEDLKREINDMEYSERNGLKLEITSLFQKGSSNVPLKLDKRGRDSRIFVDSSIILSQRGSGEDFVDEISLYGRTRRSKNPSLFNAYLEQARKPELCVQEAIINSKTELNNKRSFRHVKDIKKISEGIEVSETQL